MNDAPESLAPVDEEEARMALAVYMVEKDHEVKPSKALTSARDVLRDYAKQVLKGKGKLELDGRTITLGKSSRYPVDMKALNRLLSPEQRAEIVTESVSYSVRVK